MGALGEQSHFAVRHRAPDPLAAIEELESSP